MRRAARAGSRVRAICGIRCLVFLHSELAAMEATAPEEEERRHVQHPKGPARPWVEKTHGHTEQRKALSRRAPVAEQATA